MVRGFLISFEGGEACGKSTQIQLLAEHIRRIGRVVLVLREPGGTPLGEKIRHLLKHDPTGQGMAAETELLLMNASRAELVRRVIRPALDTGTIVLCDRFSDSTLAYQGYGRGLNATQVQQVIDLAVSSTRPDLTLWLRVPSDEAKFRLASRQQQGDSQTDRFELEQSAFFERVEHGYAARAAAEPARFKVVDGTGDVATVQARIWDWVAPLIGSASNTAPG